MDFDDKIDQKQLPTPPALENVLEIVRWSPGHPDEKTSANFIQRYAMAAVQCFIQKENPTMALMALTAFKLGDFSLANELNTLLFDDSQNVDLGRKLDAFENHFDDIIKSINSFHQNKNNDPYLVQTTIGLQMLLYAALTRASELSNNTGPTTEFRDRLLNKLSTLDTRINYPARKLLDPKSTPGEGQIIAYQPHSGEFVDSPKPAPTIAIEAQTSENFDVALRSEFKLVHELAEKNQFDQALRKFEETLQLAKHDFHGTFLVTYLPKGGVRPWAVLDGILNYLVERPTTPQKQAFALAVLNKIIEHNNHEAKTLFANKNSIFFKALLTLKPQNPESTLELARLFKNLAGHPEAYVPEFQALFNARMKQIEPMQTESRPSVVGYIVGGLFIVLAIIATIFSLTLFPLLPLYIGAGVLGGIGLLSLGIQFARNVSANRQTSSSSHSAIQQSNRNQESPSQATSMIQTNLNTWLKIYGYDLSTLSESAFIDLFKQTPHLSRSVDPNRDYKVFKGIFQNGDWNTFKKLAATFDPKDQWKIRIIIMSLGTRVLKKLVTDLEQLKIFCAALPDNEQNPRCNAAQCKAYLWDWINDNYKDYLQTLIDNTPKTIEVEISLGASCYSFGGNIAAASRRTENQDPYKMLGEIFPDREDEIAALKPEDSSKFSQSPLESTKKSHIAKKVIKKSKNEEVKNTSSEETDEDEDELTSSKDSDSDSDSEKRKSQFG